MTNIETTSHDDKEKNLKILYARYAKIDEARITLASSVYKYLFTASTGIIALVLSKGPFVMLVTLKVGIILLAICVIATILSLICSVSAFNRQLKITTYEINNALKLSTDMSCMENHWNILVTILSWTSIIFFIAGGYFVLYSFLS